MRSKRLELAGNSMSDWARTEINTNSREMYLVWSSLESDASDLGYLFGNFHIESFLRI